MNRFHEFWVTGHSDGRIRVTHYPCGRGENLQESWSSFSVDELVKLVNEHKCAEEATDEA